ncbi:MAG: hypothetical protein HQL31_10370 [Planctomycetes bacterium]|nr:hypothetical protein [Planctomycetota bacterium]
MPSVQCLRGVLVEASDGAGRHASLRLPFADDRTGPALSITELSLESGECALKGSLADPGGLGEMSWPSGIHEHAGVREANFDIRLKVPQGAAHVLLSASDQLGNVTSIRLPLPLAPAAPAGEVTSSAGPRIRWIPQRERVVVPYGEYALEALLEAGSGEIEEVLLNGQLLPTTRGRYLSLQRRVPLSQGENHFTLRVRDGVGQSESELVVERREMRAFSLAHRATLAVLPFSGGDTQVSLPLVEEALLDLHRFRLVDRSQLERILEEQKLSRSLLADKSTAIRLGKLLAARYSLSGEVRRTSGFEIVARLLDNESSQIITIADAFAPEESGAAVKNALNLLALKIRQAMPMIEARIRLIKDQRLVLDLPSGLKPADGMEFLIVEKGEDLVDESSGEILIPGEQVLKGRASLERIVDGGALCRFEMDGVMAVNKGDYAVSR